MLNQPPYKPLNVLLSYCHLSLQNSTFIDFAPHFIERAQVGQLVTASPLSMGLLTPKPPAWHPAPSELHKVVEHCRAQCPMDLPNVAIGFSIRYTGNNMPLVLGMSSPCEVHECIKAWREIQEGSRPEREKWEELIKRKFEDAGFKDWSW